MTRRRVLATTSGKATPPPPPAAGIPAKNLSERLGQANIAITMHTYGHVLPGLDKQAAGTGAHANI